MASQLKELTYGSVEIYIDDILGIGSYGKVCRAKCGQLPCAAKLLHDTLFQDNDPGTHNLTMKFLQECRFLISIKHPNIVQCLGNIRDPESRRPVLLMELMDESLTKFLERSTTFVPYHVQVNICYDVALALAYLHSNGIIHRDLSSNNVLLIGSGSRAKVTDFGMSKFVDMNPRMTPLTQCPGTSAYMPPEALTAPPQYSSKMDCFSLGVLAIQVETRNFPDPGDPTTVMKDARFPTGRALFFIPEADRRKKDIDLIAPDHPLLPIILQCIKDEEGERPSANELCERLASLKRESRYTHSVEQTRDQTSRAQTLQLLLEKKDEDHQQELARELVRKDEEHQQELARELVRKDEEHQQELALKEREKQELERKNEELERGYQQKLMKKTEEHQHELERNEQEIKELRQELRKKGEELQEELARKEELAAKIENKLQITEDADSQHLTSKPLSAVSSVPVTEAQKEKERSDEIPAGQMKLSWRKGKQAPRTLSSAAGAAVVHGNTAFFSCYFNVYSYNIFEDEWTKLQQCEYQCTSLAIVHDTLTTVGGHTSNYTPTNTLLSLSQSGSRWKWGKGLPSMTTKRILPATVTITTHLVVAAGAKEYLGDGLSTVEVLDTETLQWSMASSLPQDIAYSKMTLCSGYVYLSGGNTVFSCSVEGLLQSCQLPPHKPTSINSSKSGSIWTRQANIPVGGSSLATLGEHVLAIGGENSFNDPTANIHCYDRTTNSWSVIGEMPTPRFCPLTLISPDSELIVVGGRGGIFKLFDITEIGHVVK